MTDSNQLAVAPRASFDLSPQTFDQALTFSKYLAESDMVPKDFKGRPGNCLVAMQWGAEIGLKPLQAMQNIAVINGRPALWGDALLALVMSSPVCKDVIERYEGQGETLTAVCIAQRHGRADKIARFGMAEAKAAGLLGKQGPWLQYRDRMLKLRARAFAIRDQFPDVLKGMAVAEEVMDTPGEPRNMGPAEVVQEFYPADKFAKNLPAWRKAIAEGRKTADDVIAMVESKSPLTEEQKAEIRGATPALASSGGQGQQAAAADEAPTVTFAQVNDRLLKAQNIDQLNEAADLIGSIADEEQRRELAQVFDGRQADLIA